MGIQGVFMGIHRGFFYRNSWDFHGNLWSLIWDFCWGKTLSKWVDGEGVISSQEVRCVVLWEGSGY